MTTTIEQFAYAYPKPYIREQDLLVPFQGNVRQRDDAIKYALSQHVLSRIRRGLYLINSPHHHCDPFELAQVIYGPSYISLESALSFHGWIPEAVYVITSVTSRRSKLFANTPLGRFSYQHIPQQSFYLQVERITNNKDTLLMANPWKAIADCIYVYKKNWQSLQHLCGDMRIEAESIESSDINALKMLVKHYPSKNVKQHCHLFLKELINDK